MNPSTAMRTVDKLESLGLVDRQINPANRREVILRLTAVGRGLVQQVLARIANGRTDFPSFNRFLIIARCNDTVSQAASSGVDAAGTVRRVVTVGTDSVHEAYSFVCLRCGRGWEQEYRIVRSVDLSGRPQVQYLVDGVRVPSPLTQAACPSCDGRKIRTLRFGRVDSAHLHHD